MCQFKTVSDAEIKYGTSLKGYISTTYEALHRAFGEPLEGDGYKVSGEWVFHDDDGSEYTVYDWKCTDLYESINPSVSELRARKTPMLFNVGGFDASKTHDFIKFLESKLPGAKGSVGW